MFLTERRCVVCGATTVLEHCHIVGRLDNEAVRPMYNKTHLLVHLSSLSSGIYSKSWNGLQQASRGCLGMNPEVDY